MAAKRVNVLVYADTGATTNSIRHATHCLRRLLGPNYAVLPVTAEQIIKEPWLSTCALLVFPGGADLGYCRSLNGPGNRRIKQFVSMGGKYLGLCAGGYYGCGRCEWEVGQGQDREVVGDRELGFFPGTCRGLAFEGFVYHSEAGTRAVEVEVADGALPAGEGKADGKFRTYYNGGGVFVDAEAFKDRGVAVVARYTEPLTCEGGNAAVVYCRYGEGAALLTGPHPEFSGWSLNPSEPSGHADYVGVVEALRKDEEKRVEFVRGCLRKLGLEVSSGAEGGAPSLSRIHLSAVKPEDVSELLQGWQEAGLLKKGEDGNERIEGENDVFILDQEGRLGMKEVKDALPGAEKTAKGEQVEGLAGEAPQDETSVDYNAVPKHILPHESTLPSTRETPHFNHHAYFSALAHYNDTSSSDSSPTFGHHLLYGEVVTSTSTLLEKNISLLSHLPVGFTATATTQVAGRGRGNNVWVSPPGSLMFSTVLRHPLSLGERAPVVFVQYLAALAIVAGIQGYDAEGGSKKGGGYERLPVKLKWPNDIYALDPTVKEGEEGRYVKIGGILVNSSYAGGDYTLVVGIGLNVANPAPTTSLSVLAAKLQLPPFTLEKLLASILTNFERLYTRFTRTGFDREFEGLYYRSWLHTDQVVRLEEEGGVKARIKGITTDWGLLVAEELNWEGKSSGKLVRLQSDSNSFDFFRGLVRRKL